MSRFYQTADRRYVDDFVYRPPIEMMQGVLQQKNADIEDTLAQMDLFHNLPLDYWKGYDDDIAAGIQDEVSGRVDELATALTKDALNPQNKRQLRQLAQELEKRSTTGDISNLRENAKRYNEYMAKVNAMQNPYSREIAMKQIEDYKNNNNLLREEGGGFGNLFEYKDPYDFRNWAEDYTKSSMFQKLGISSEATITDKKNGFYILRDGNKTVSLPIEQVEANFKAWFAQENPRGYAEYMQQYAGQQWIDEKTGEFDFKPGSMLDNIMTEALPTLTYEQKEESKTLTPNSMAWNIFEYNEAKKAAADIQNKEQPFINPTEHKVATAFKENSEAYNILQKTIQGIRNSSPYFSKKTEEEIYQIIEANKESIKTKNKPLYDAYTVWKNTQEKWQDASSVYFVQALGGVDEWKAAEKQMQERAEVVNWHVPTGGDGSPVSTTTIKFNTLGGKKIKDIPELINLPQFKGKGDYEIIGVENKSDIRAIPDVTETIEGESVATSKMGNWLAATDLVIFYTDGFGKKQSVKLPVYAQMEGNFVTTPK